MQSQSVGSYLRATSARFGIARAFATMMLTTLRDGCRAGSSNGVSRSMKGILALFTVIGTLMCFAGLASAQQYSVQQCTDLQQKIRKMQQTKITNQLGGGQKCGTEAVLKDLQQEYQENCTVHTARAVVYPTYQILALMYSPPGCTGTTPQCVASGQVDYQNGSSAGTKVSIDQSFKNSQQVSVDVTLGDPDVAALEGGGSAGWAITNTDSSSETISKSQTNDLSLESFQDGIDHNQDVFWLLMNPAVVVSTLGTQVSWNMGYKGRGPSLVRVAVHDLIAYSFTPTSSLYNLTPLDCSTIVKQDPFAKGSTVISQRFVYTAAYNYEPSSSCSSVSGKYEHEQDADASHTVEVEITTGYSEGASGGYGIIKASMKASQDFTWTNTSSKTATTGSTQTASFTLPCPANDTGNSWIAVYWDSLYGTFMFMPTNIPGLVIHQGHVSDSAGKLVRYQIVTLSYGGKTYHTATNGNGDYRFFAPQNAPKVALPATGQLTVMGFKQAVTLRASAPVQNIRIQSDATVKKGMTWQLDGTNPTARTIDVGCGNGCDAYKGDTAWTGRVAILCIKKQGAGFPLPLPAGVDNTDRYHQWSGGIVGTTEATVPPTERAAANALCVEKFGEGWRVAEFHDGWGWHFQASGSVGDSHGRFWVDVNDQPATCWK